jgi:acyl-homoserine lactone acylase PvdQ
MLQRTVGRWVLVVAAMALLLDMAAPAAVAGAAQGTAAPKATSSGLSSGVVVGSGSESATIKLDTYGVPHIYADTSTGMWYGDGWA